MEKQFARQCTVTGVGMNNGWVYDEGTAYYSTEEIAEKAMIEVGFSSLDEAYEAGVIYWTEWDENDID